MVNLSKIIEGLEMVNDGIDCYYNPKKDEILKIIVLKQILFKIGIIIEKKNIKK